MDLLERDTFAAEAVGPIVFALWRGDLNGESVERVGALLHRTAQAHPGGIAFITVAEYRAPIPPAPIRARIVEIYGELGSQLSGVAQVVEGTGFWASAALCFIAGVGLLNKHTHPMKVFGRTDAAIDWVGSLGVPQAHPLQVVRARVAHRARALDRATAGSAELLPSR